MGIAEELAEARANVARLEREVSQATCREVGHRWKHMGGRNCGCHDGASCSVPVHECTVCGDCDYGENRWSDETRAECPHNKPGEG